MSEKKIELLVEAGRIMRAAMRLDDVAGVEVYLALHGNTGCICVQVTENKSLVYENRCFRTNAEKMVEIRQDLQTMLNQKWGECSEEKQG